MEYIDIACDMSCKYYIFRQRAVEYVVLEKNANHMHNGFLCRVNHQVEDKIKQFKKNNFTTTTAPSTIIECLFLKAYFHLSGSKRTAGSREC